MKYFFNIIAIIILCHACEDVIYPDLPIEDAPIAIEAMLYRKAEAQVIKVSKANTYFDSSDPVGVSGAVVTVTDLDNDNPYVFSETEAGTYVWAPSNPSDSFGIIGNSYRLDIDVNKNSYTSFSQINRVPKIDSITWRLEPETPFSDASYFGEYWARDFEGEGDVYWIKSWKNGTLLTNPSELIIAYDAGFSEDGNADGSLFIQPIRDGMNPFDLDEDDQLVAPYILGDSAYVEINSITPEAFFFLQQVQIQINRPGGFGELFATPLANVQSNIFSDDPTKKVVGFFCTAATSGLGRKFTEDAIFEDSATN